MFKVKKERNKLFFRKANMFFCSCRCSILMNDTVKCDGGLYKSLQAWKDHKLHIEHEVLKAHKISYTGCYWLVVYYRVFVAVCFFLLCVD